MKRFLALVLCMVLIFTMLCSCTVKKVSTGGTKESTGERKESTSNSTSKSATTAPSAQKAPVTISFFGVDVRAIDGYSLRDGLWVWEELGKRLNQKYVFNTTNDYWDLIDLRLFSGEKLEDLYCIGYNDLQRPAREGLLTPLDDLIDKYGPNIKALIEKVPNKKIHNTSLHDGKTYSFSETLYKCTAGETILLMGRKDWLDKLNLNVPDTTDEFFEVLLAFRNNDPNENGQKDELPLGGNILELTQYLSGSFGLHGLRNGFIWVENDQVIVEETTERFKEMLMYLNKLYKNELIALPGDFPENTIGMNWTLYNSADGNIKTFLGDVPGAEVFGMLIPEGPHGDRVIEEFYTEAKRYVIPIGCEHPEEVVRLVDYLSTEEGNLLYEFGLEDVHYTMLDGEPAPTELVTASGNIQAEYEKLGIGIQIIPRVKPFTPAYQRALRPKAAEEPWSKMYDYFVKGYFMVNVPQTKEEKELTERPELYTYINACKVAFVTGEMSFDKWDDYLAELKKQGVEEFVQALQAVFERAYKSK